MQPDLPLPQTTPQNGQNIDKALDEIANSRRQQVSRLNLAGSRCKMRADAAYRQLSEEDKYYTAAEQVYWISKVLMISGDILLTLTGLLGAIRAIGESLALGALYQAGSIGKAALMIEKSLLQKGLSVAGRQRLCTIAQKAAGITGNTVKMTINAMAKDLLTKQGKLEIKKILEILAGVTGSVKLAYDLNKPEGYETLLEQLLQKNLYNNPKVGSLLDDYIQDEFAVNVIDTLMDDADRGFRDELQIIYTASQKGELNKLQNAKVRYLHYQRMQDTYTLLCTNAFDKSVEINQKIRKMQR